MNQNPNAIDSRNSDEEVRRNACDVLVVGGGPAGLMAAEVLSGEGLAVHLFDAMPTVGRKFLLAGIGGLNLTHAESFSEFCTRFGERSPECSSWLERFGPAEVRAWAHALGIDTFVGSSQRVFPTDMKAAPLLRAWLHRLRHPVDGRAVAFHMRRRWTGHCRAVAGGWELEFTAPDEQTERVVAQAVVFALGGGSWARLGSDGAWQDWLKAQGADVIPLRPANCGFEVEVRQRRGWSDYLASRHAGEPLKNVGLSFGDDRGRQFARKGEFVLTASGVEGSLVYAASALLRDEVERHGRATFELDLRPDLSLERVQAELTKPRRGKSLGNVLKARLGLSGAAIALLHELLERPTLDDPLRLAARVKGLAITVVAARPLDEAISSAGGVALEALTPDLMLREAPGLFCAGEMLDWEAPTGGYLLTACLASGRVAGEGARDFLSRSLSRNEID
ncbi:MAG: hypothetical protein RJA36_1552 [Pseudomonadota bacterium]|jgi:uncharacterized flavoprotein (TIGR03862 family)